MRLMLLGVWLSVLCVTSVAAQTTKFYDKNMNSTGSISREGSRDVERDRNGNARGYYERQGNQTVHRDMNGNRLGSYTH